MENGKWRILVVDDEPDVRLVIKTTLEPNYEVVEAHDGLDALEKMERFEPDFVLMDVMMPLMNGFEACASIRKNPKFRELPVMFLSALGSKEDIKKGYSHGANLYLTKPFEPQRLMRNIDMFFQETPPKKRRRLYSLDELKKAEKNREPAAPGSAEYQKSEPEKPKGETPQQEAKPGMIPRVMVVDDDSENIELIRISLEGIAEVVWAGDGLEAVEKLVKFQPDILLLDIMLPKMNGFQLCQSLRANRAFARIPIMMCSAKGSSRDITMAKRMGANEYLVKPFSPADLIKKIKELQKLPGFRVRPKTFELTQIRDMETPAAEKDVFQEADARLKETRDSNDPEALKKFLAKEAKKDALDRQVEQEDKKKKRRFFGLGSKE